MATNYSQWTIEKLHKEIDKIQKIIKLREVQDKKETLAKVKAMARKNGFELHELLSDNEAKVKAAPVAKKAPASKSKKVRGKVAPKYRNPADASVTWTGRGRKPLWVAAHLKSGGSLDDIAI